MSVNDIIRNLNLVEIELNRKLNDAIKDCALDLLGKAKNLAPIDTGELRASGRADFGDKKATVSFNTPYALRQHEDLTFRHPQGGQAKYLEQPFNQNKDKYERYIQDKIRLR